MVTTDKEIQLIFWSPSFKYGATLTMQPVYQVNWLLPPFLSLSLSFQTNRGYLEDITHHTVKFTNSGLTKFFFKKEIERCLGFKFLYKKLFK